jgi:TPR repeat protein
MKTLKLYHLPLIFALLATPIVHATDHPELSPGDEAYSAEHFEEAAKLYRKEAELGISAAQVNLAFVYLDGIGVAQNYQEAAHWFVKAAEQDNAEAQQNLGVLYQQGKLGTANSIEADKWFRLAKAGKDIQAIEKTMTPSQISEAKRLADAWLAQFKTRR